MRLPAWSELIEEQKTIFEFPLDKNLFVAGPPGSGKTTLAIQRAQLLKGASKSTSIITYNRMLRRLISLVSKNAIHSSTMHSYVARHFRSLTSKNIPTHPSDRYAYDWTQITCQLKDKAQSANRLGHLVIDEGQDLDPGFFNYAVMHIGVNVTVFADDDQTISDRGSTLEQIRTAACLPQPILLKENHRNSPEIAKVAEYFHNGRLPAARVRRQFIGEPPVLASVSNLEQAANRISNWFSNRGGSIGVIVNLNSTGIALKERISKIIPSNRIDLYTSSDCNEDAINILATGITILNRQSVKGQEFDTVFICELEALLPCDSIAKRRALYMMCSRARDFLFLLYATSAITSSSGDALACLPGPELLKREA